MRTDGSSAFDFKEQFNHLLDRVANELDVDICENHPRYGALQRPCEIRVLTCSHCHKTEEVRRCPQCLIKQFCEKCQKSVSSLQLTYKFNNDLWDRYYCPTCAPPYNP